MQDFVDAFKTIRTGTGKDNKISYFASTYYCKYLIPTNRAT